MHTNRQIHTYTHTHTHAYIIYLCIYKCIDILLPHTHIHSEQVRALGSSSYSSSLNMLVFIARFISIMFGIRIGNNKNKNKKKNIKIHQQQKIKHRKTEEIFHKHVTGSIGWFLIFICMCVCVCVCMLDAVSMYSK